MSCGEITRTVTRTASRLLAGKIDSPFPFFIDPTLKKILLGGVVVSGNMRTDRVDRWDPVTGLGTPSYERMQALFMSLP